jgi:hypothetical protein
VVKLPVTQVLPLGVGVGGGGGGRGVGVGEGGGGRGVGVGPGLGGGGLVGPGVEVPVMKISALHSTSSSRRST